jgi:hypothetical protein
MHRNVGHGLRCRTGKAALIFVMSKQPAPQDDDICPNCHVPLEIVSVKIGLARVTMRCICPNCGMARAENPDGKPGKNKRKRGKRSRMSFLKKLSYPR